jgi:hypothetical protein
MQDRHHISGCIMRLEQIDFKNKRASHRELGMHEGFALLTSWSAVTVLFCITFGITYLGLMIRDGAFDDVWKSMTAEPVKVVDKSWMLGDKRRVRDDRVIERAAPAPRPAAQEEAPFEPGPEAATTRID